MSGHTCFRHPVCNRLLASATLGLILIANASAQTAAFTYQGKLVDNGNPVSGSYDTQFKLFDSTDFVTGNQIGTTITNLAMQITNGAVSVQLDFGPNVFDGSPRFLEIGIRPAGSPNAFTVLSPRQPLTSTPYAVRSASAALADTATNAGNSAQLGGVAASQYVITTDARLSDARPPAAGSANYIQNSASQQAATNFNISGNGTMGGDLMVGGALSINIVNAQTQFNLANNRLLASPGTGNLFAGIDAGTSNTTGSLNSFVGTMAGNANTAGGGDSFFGWKAGLKNTTGCCNSFFGELAGSNTTSGNENSFFGDQTGVHNATGSDNTFIGRGADFGPSGASGVFNTLLGAGAIIGSGVNHSTAIGANASASTSNTVVLGTASDVVVISGLGTAGGSSLCRNASNQIANCSSSLRYKTGVQQFTAGLEIVSRLRPISFIWEQDGAKDIGLAAEDVERVEPLLTFRNDKGEIEGVKHNQLSAVFINTFKQQQLQIKQQRRQIDRQQAQIKALRQEIETRGRKERQEFAELKTLICADHPEAAVCKSH